MRRLHRLVSAPTKALPVFAGVLSVLLVSNDARADGIDTVALLTWVSSEAELRRSPSLVVALVIGAMLVNYSLNLLVIGMPVSRAGGKSLRNIAFDLIGFTFVAQLADRIGIVVGLVAGMFAAMPFAKGEDALVLGIGFIVSAVALAGLVVLFARRGWNVPKGRLRRIALLAGILTNPLPLAALFWWVRFSVSPPPAF